MTEAVKLAIEKMQEANKAEIKRREELAEEVCKTDNIGSFISHKRDMKYWDGYGRIRPNVFVPPVEFESYRAALKEYVDTLEPEATREFSEKLDEYNNTKAECDRKITEAKAELAKSRAGLEECRQRWNSLLAADFLKVSRYIPGKAANHIHPEYPDYSIYATQLAMGDWETTPARMAACIRASMETGVMNEKRSAERSAGNGKGTK